MGFIDNTLPLGKAVNGPHIIGRLADLPALIARHDVGGAVIGIGDNWKRAAVVASIRALVPELRFPNVIHPSAQVAGHVRFGEGSVVLAGVVVNYWRPSAIFAFSTRVRRWTTIRSSATTSAWLPRLARVGMWKSAISRPSAWGPISSMAFASAIKAWWEPGPPCWTICRAK